MASPRSRKINKISHNNTGRKGGSHVNVIKLPNEER